MCFFTEHCGIVVIDYLVTLSNCDGRTISEFVYLYIYFNFVYLFSITIIPSSLVLVSSESLCTP